MTGVLAAMFMLVRRAKRATYKRYAGKAGSAEVALQMLPKKWVDPGRRKRRPRGASGSGGRNRLTSLSCGRLKARRPQGARSIR